MPSGDADSIADGAVVMGDKQRLSSSRAWLPLSFLPLCFLMTSRLGKKHAFKRKEKATAV